MQPPECAEVERFWTRCTRTTPPYPFGLEDVLHMHFKVTIVPLPRLATAVAGRWLARRGWPGLTHSTEHPLHGCIVARAGDAFIFVEATDPPDEQQFTLAHEAGHLLLDYLEPREDVVQFLGEDQLAVLDGVRPPTAAERVSAVMANCPIGVYVQQLDYDSPRTSRSERRADRFARELLAPRASLAAIPLTEIEATLVQQFGLPAAQAEIYANDLRAERAPAPSHLDWLRPSPRPRPATASDE